MQLITQRLEYQYLKGAPFESIPMKSDPMVFEFGKIYGVIGGTGSGKSTFCKALAGLLPIQIHQQNDLRFGYVFQQPEHQLFAETLKEELEFGLKNFKVPESEWDERIEYGLNAVNLKRDLLSNDPFTLSGGMKRRSAIASILCLRPDVFILDEPTAGLDPVSRRILLENLLKFRNPDCLILWISHELGDLMSLADSFLSFSGGEGRIFESSLEALEFACLERFHGYQSVQDMMKRGLTYKEGMDRFREAWRRANGSSV